ncbi:MAG: PQQ-binding-like beta-propeller repeat protein [Candidatus Latescibacteria bacterium]|nr:PQQ-binding-like beta-propeller repeat protein [Candidatus Latescibacterota bacterium]
MNKKVMVWHRFSRFLLVVACLIGFSIAAVDAQWAQWGGPNGNFQVSAMKLSTDWGEAGPKNLWRRDLGEGYSAISVDDGVLYTMYRRGEEEVVIALDAQNGETRWEYVYAAPKWEKFNAGKGPGPHATPLIVGDYVYTVGVRTHLHCLDKKTGKEVWSHDLWEKFGAKPPDRGYSSSPIVYKNMLILPVGGRSGHGIMAFDPEDGRVIWKSQNDPATFSSPKIITVDGQDQVVVFGGKQIVGLEPTTGDLLWTHSHPTKYDINAMTPVWGEGNLLFASSAYDGGSRVIHLAQKSGKTTVEEVWYSKAMEVHHGTAIRLGDMIYTSSGDFGPAFLMGVNAKTGEMTAKQRGFAKANMLAVGNDVILLDENGELAIATPSVEGFKVHAKAQIFSTRAWAVPTLVGATLYARDRKEIVALNLSP